MAKEREYACGGMLGGKDRAERRLSMAFDAVANLRDYRKVLSAIEQLPREDRESCSGLAAGVTDLAFEAEASGRVLIQSALDSINDMRDEGTFYASIGEVAKELSGDGAARFFEKLRKGGAHSKFGDAAAELAGEGAEAAEALGLEFSPQRDSLVLRRKYGPEGESRLHVATTRALGQAGRVSSAEFFGGRDGIAFVTSPGLYIPADCHHRPLRAEKDHARAVDAYAGVVGGLATTKGLLYQHARRVAELGPRGLRGEDPVTAIVVAIAVVGAALVVYGIATGNVGMAAFGAVLIIGAAFVAFGGYTLIIAVFA